MINSKDFLDKQYSEGVLSASAHCIATAKADTENLATIDLLDIVYCFATSKLSNKDYNRLISLVESANKDYLLNTSPEVTIQVTLEKIEQALANLVQGVID